jgi:DNA-binding LacI/PurR family transcriptional regulator
MITAKELAKLASVSQSTVSRSLNDSPLISEKKKSEIKQLAKQYKFELNSQAKSLRTRRTNTIGILFPSYFMNLSTNLYFTYLYDCLQFELSKYDYDLLMIYDSKEQAPLSPLEKMIRRRKVDGLILVRPDLRSDEKGMLESCKLPYVSVFSLDPEDEGSSRYSINTHEGGVLAGSFFARLEGYSPMYFGSSTDNFDSRNRLSGFSAGWSKGGRDPGEIQTLACEMSIPGAYQTVMDNISCFREKRSVYAYNDMMACGMLMAFKDQQIRVPEQIQLISNDDIPLAVWMSPQLSTLRFPNKQLLETACQRLVGGIRSGKMENENLQLSPELVLRGTTRE